MMLDCETPATTLFSLASAAGCSTDLIRDAVYSYRELDFADTHDEMWVTVPRDLLARARVDITDVQFGGAYYFHGTRVLDPTTFVEHGIRPLGAAIDAIWLDLHQLCADRVTDNEWKAIRRDVEGGAAGCNSHAAWLYRFKLSDSTQHGPFGSMIRRHALHPQEHFHDYLAAPEIIEDIAAFTDIGLLNAFKKASRSCAVEYRLTESVSQKAVEAAVLHLLEDLQGTSFGIGSYWGDNREGVAVPASDVIYVDELRRGGSRFDTDAWLRHPGQAIAN